MKQLSNNALTVLAGRYLLRNQSGTITESPDELFQRVAEAIAAGESSAELKKKYTSVFFELLSSLEFLPNSPTLMNAGTIRQQLSACFVLPIEDSLESIFDTLKHAALIHQSGGGTGFNFSRVRPEADYLPESGGTASGPLSFMELYDASTERIKQGGKRRGANMAILNCTHPDIEKFINAKRDTKALNNFNISVGVTDSFIQAVESDQLWNLINPNGKTISRTIRARKLWEAIVDAAWTTGDPGIIFLDTIQKSNPTPVQGVIDTTNPCGEVPLLPYEACNLGSVNLSLMVSKDGTIDYKKLECVIEKAVRFLDNVVEVNNYILPQIQSVVKHNRKIGLGVMGWAELLIQLEIPYASEKAVALARSLMKFINETAKQSSENIATEKGNFPGWELSIYNNESGLRNATRTAIAPTGTIAVIAGTSPSIEPLYALALRRENVLGGKILEEINTTVIAFLKKKNVFSNELFALVQKEGHLENSSLPEEYKSVIRTAAYIAPEWHLRHQAAFQEFTDNAVSKTINLPNNASREQIAAIYLKAAQLGLKGITVYRDGCKPSQVMNAGTSCEICAT